MSDLATALAAQILGEFEGVEVRGAGIEIPNAAGGLREALKIEPQTFHGGDKLYAVFELDCKKIRHDPITDGKDGPMIAWKRIHVLSAEGATFVDADVAKGHIDAQRERIQRAKDEATGQQSATSEFEAQHEAGEHASGLIDGCPQCEAEREAEQAEASVPASGPESPAEE